MKPLWKSVCALFYFVIFNFFSASSQCGNTLQSITYDTLIIGTGNDTHSITLSQFDPSIGTLISANINSTVSINYGFTLKNVEAVQRDFSVSVGRYDHFASTALSSPYSNLIDTSIGDYILNPGDSVFKAPYTVLYRYDQNDSITSNVVNFLGSNTIAFDYKPITYTNLTGSNIYYYSATANDTIHFSITYYYCSNTILENLLTSFSAEKENEGLVKLSWATSGNQSGVHYEIQTSSDSIFSSIASVSGNPGTNNYSYDYKIAGIRQSKIYFRLKIITSSGEVKYSEIKAVNIFDESIAHGIIFPNPSRDYINISLQKGDWDIGLFTPLGGLLQQYHFSNTSLAHIIFKSKLPSGVYFVQAQNITSAKKLVLNFVVE